MNADPASSKMMRQGYVLVHATVLALDEDVPALGGPIGAHQGRVEDGLDVPPMKERRILVRQGLARPVGDSALEQREVPRLG
jgi:hypothetical protein